MIDVPRLASLSDLMQRFQPRLLTSLASLEGGLTALNEANPSDDKLTNKARDAMKEIVGRLEKHLSPLGLVASFATVARMTELLEQPNARYDELTELIKELHGRVADETDAIVFFSIDPSKRALYTGTTHFGDAVGKRFAATAGDVEEAGKCLALDRGTACVFHLMRILEVGLQELGAKLSLTLASPNWQEIINAVNGAVKRLPHKTTEEKAFLARASETALQLQHVKDAWRNDVMHPRDVYTEEQAQDVFDTCKRLMKSLAEWI